MFHTEFCQIDYIFLKDAIYIVQIVMIFNMLFLRDVLINKLFHSSRAILVQLYLKFDIMKHR